VAKDSHEEISAMKSMQGDSGGTVEDVPLTLQLHVAYDSRLEALVDGVHLLIKLLPRFIAIVDLSLL